MEMEMRNLFDEHEHASDKEVVGVLEIEYKEILQLWEKFKDVSTLEEIESQILNKWHFKKSLKDIEESKAAAAKYAKNKRQQYLKMKKWGALYDILPDCLMPDIEESGEEGKAACALNSDSYIGSDMATKLRKLEEEERKILQMKEEYEKVRKRVPVPESLVKRSVIHGILDRHICSTMATKLRKLEEEEREVLQRKEDYEKLMKSVTIPEALVERSVISGNVEDNYVGPMSIGELEDVSKIIETQKTRKWLFEQKLKGIEDRKAAAVKYANNRRQELLLLLQLSQGARTENVFIPRELMSGLVMFLQGVGDWLQLKRVKRD